MLNTGNQCMDSLPASVADRRAVSRSEASQEVLYFRASSMQLCVPLDYVSKVLPLMTLQPVPGAPPYLRGLMNLHGTSIPVMDLAARLGHTTSQSYTLDTPILMCSYEGRHAGLIISEVQEVRSIDNRERQINDVLSEGNLPFLAVFNSRHGLALMLDIQKVLDIGMLDDGTELYVNPDSLLEQLS